MNGFVTGLIVGAVVGVGATLVLRGERDPAPPAPPAGDADAGALPPAPTLEALHGDPTPVAQPPAPGVAAPAPTAAPKDDPTPEASAKTAYAEALAKVRGELRAVRDAAPGSEEVLKLIAVLRTLQASSDPQMARLAGRALVYLAGYGKLRPEDVQSLAHDYAQLPAGAQARPGLAATVALAWAKDERLGAWLRDLPASSEPDIRATVVEALDESPSDAYRNYLVHLSQTERNHDVLDAAWHEDPISVAMNRDFAPRLIAAIESRVAEGDLPILVRGRAHFALGLAAVHDAPGATAAIQGLLPSESDKGVRAFAQAVLDAIARDEANIQSLDGLWNRMRRAFGTE